MIRQHVTLMTMPGARRARALAALSLAAALLIASCGRKQEHFTSEVEVVRAAALPSGPDDPVWEGVPVCAVPLILQDMVEPRLLVPTTPRVLVQAMTDGAAVAIRMAWTDSTRDDLPGASRFSDACAVQVPRGEGADLPAPQMGEPGRGVEIAYWSSSWQAVVDGRDMTDIRSLYPNAEIGHYPFEAASLEKGSPDQVAMESRYAPARAVGNLMAGDGEHAVQALTAEGPGTLTPAPSIPAGGRGMRTADGWEVLISRPAPASLSTTGRAHAAFAVWQGADDEAGARKMRSVWIAMAIREDAR